MLYTPNMIVGWMSKYIIFKKIGKNYPECSGGIELINEYHRQLQPDILYIGNAADISKLLDNPENTKEAIILLCAGDYESLHSRKYPEGISIICFKLDLITLYNKIHHYVHEFLSWNNKLQKELYTNNGLQALLDAANEAMRSSMVLLNAGYRLLASSCNPDIHDPILEKVCEAGMMTYDDVKTISKGLKSQHLNLDKADQVEYLPEHSGLYSYIWNIKYNGTIVARLIVVLNQSEPSPAYSDFCRVIIEHITSFYLSGQSINYGQNELFGSLVADIIEGRIHDDKTLEERLKPVQLAFNNYYYLLIVNFPEAMGLSDNATPVAFTHLPWNYIISQFEQLIPFSNITTYKNELIILHKKTNYSPTLELKNREEIQELLEHYNGYMMLGNFSKFMNSLGSIYHQTEDAFRLARAMTHDKTIRIFQYEEHSIYQVIEMASIGLLTKHGLANPIYLCPPSLVSLYRYDKKHSTKFCSILREYLNSDCNAAETARKLFMHRNTMLYNITKIQDILGLTLDDPMLKLRLLLGFAVMDYVENYLNENLTDLKPNITND